MDSSPSREKDPKHQRQEAKQSNSVTMDAQSSDVTDADLISAEKDAHNPQEGASNQAIPTRPEAPKGNQTSDPIRIPPEIVPSFRIIRKQVKALTRANYNYDTLDNAIKEHRLPKGLSPSKIPLTVPDVSTKIQLAWEKAHVDLNQRLTDLLGTHWKNRKEDLAKEYKSTIKFIKDNSNDKVLGHIIELLSRYKLETVITLYDRTQKKMASTKRMDKKETGNTNTNPGQEPGSEPIKPSTDTPAT